MEFRPINHRDYETRPSVSLRSRMAASGCRSSRFKRMMENTNRSVAAFEGLRIVRFARALCDEVTNGYISMVAVAADRRGQGIGSELVRQLIGDDADITWVLRAGRGSDGFWMKMGFTPSPVAMQKCRL